MRGKANALPLTPGVYIMKNAEGKVIYVGKSKALKNRVGQYFKSAERHNEKTRRMVASVFDFDCILTDTEIEALALENKLIKLYAPRYNIRLKDGKSYPYIRVERRAGQFPHVTVTRSRKKDGADYFGPYSGMKTAYGILETLRRVFSLPDCKYLFPKDTGRVKPCLYRQMGRCSAPCVSLPEDEELKKLSDSICLFLRGGHGQVKAELKAQMERCSENLRFETAALIRDRLKALDRLLDRQNVVGKPGEEFDVISVYEDDKSACLCVLYIRDGALLDSEFLDVGGDTILDGDAVTALLTELYIRREYMPREVLIGYPLTIEELETLDSYLASIGKKTNVRVPERGAKKQLCDLAANNAREHLSSFEKKDEKNLRSLMRLASLIGMEALPERIEAIDISNFGNEEITAGIVCFENGEPLKSAYRLYKMRDVKTQDDYASMCEALRRRAAHRDDQPFPDLLLVDGGKGHVRTVKKLFDSLGIDLPVIGMVKDEFHKTRALTDGENELSIAGEQSVYMLIYRIQEEAHRFSVRASSGGKSKKLKHSVLEEIPGIGMKKAKKLLSVKGGIAFVKQASREELALIPGITAGDADRIYRHFHDQ